MPFLVLLLCLFGALAVHGEESTRLKVGVFDRPPYAVKDDTGKWSGLGVELWEDIAENLKLPFDYVEMPLEDILSALHEGRLDVSVGEIGVSAERERRVDFTQPFLINSAAVALHRNSARTDWRIFFSGLTENGFVYVLSVMMATLFVFSFLLWLIERGVHQSHFGGRPIHGFGSALWFSAVTMTTVGYGDKTPQTPLGRLLAFLWMFSGILLVSAFTGSVASNVTVARLNSSVIHVSDLVRFRNGVLEGSLSEDLLRTMGITAKKFDTVESGLQALQENEVSSFLGDQIALRYVVAHRFAQDIEVIALPSIHIAYAFAVRPHFPHLEDLNVAVIERTGSSNWAREVGSWTGGQMPVLRSEPVQGN